MVRYLFDTDHISCLQRRAGEDYSRLMRRVGQCAADDFVLSIVSFHEQILGAHNFINRAKSNRDIVRGYILLQEILQGFSIAPVLPFDLEAVAVFEALRSEPVRISTMDLRIAAIALSRHLIVLTRNDRDFSKVPGLVTEDWTK